MKKMYRVEPYLSNKISTVEIERETEVSVWIKGSRHKKESYYSLFFNTLEEAKKHVLEYEEERVKRAGDSLEYAKNRLKETQEYLENLELD